MDNIIEGTISSTAIDFLKYRALCLEKGKRRGLAVVFDITNQCNLSCLGCGVDAKNIYSLKNGSNTSGITALKSGH